MTNDLGKLRVAAVLLAGGESTRMGEPKALLPWLNKEPIVSYQIHALHHAGYSPIVVVLGHDPSSINAALPDDVHVTAIVNDRYRSGRTTSIVTGALHVATTDIDGLLIISVDQPRSVAMLRTLREAWESEQTSIAIPSLNGKGGHPPLFGGGLIPELLQITEEGKGLRQVMRSFAEERLFVPVNDPLTLTNLNTHNEYEAALAIATEE